MGRIHCCRLLKPTRINPLANRGRAIHSVHTTVRISSTVSLLVGWRASWRKGAVVRPARIILDRYSFVATVWLSARGAMLDQLETTRAAVANR